MHRACRRAAAGCMHLVDAAVDELLPSFNELLYGGQVAALGSFEEQARSFLLRGANSGTRVTTARGFSQGAVQQRAPFALAPPR
jgi:hypothetical protein